MAWQQYNINVRSLSSVTLLLYTLPPDQVGILADKGFMEIGSEPDDGAKFPQTSIFPTAHWDV